MALSSHEYVRINGHRCTQKSAGHSIAALLTLSDFHPRVFQPLLYTKPHQLVIWVILMALSSHEYVRINGHRCTQKSLHSLLRAWLRSERALFSPLPYTKVRL
jgi:hypothetical protein